MTFEGIDWNGQYVALLSEEEFVTQSIREGHYGQFSRSDQIEMLKEVYKIVTAGISNGSSH